MAELSAPFEDSVQTRAGEWSELETAPLPASPVDSDCRRGNVPGRDAVGLEDDDVLAGLPPLQLSGNQLVQLMHLKPVEDAARDRLDQIARLDLRLSPEVAADERDTPAAGAVTRLR